MNETIFSIEYYPSQEEFNKVTINIDHNWPLIHLCGDTFMIATLGTYHFSDIYLPYNKTVVFSNLN